MTAASLPPLVTGAARGEGALVVAVGAALLAACAAWVAVGPPPLARLAGTADTRAPSVPLLVLVAGGGTAALLLGAAPWAVLATSGLLALSPRWHKRRARRLEAQRTRAAVVETCTVLSGTLRAGGTPEAAFARASAEVPDLVRLLTPVAATVRMGGDVPQALRHAACGPGADGLERLAACWQVASASGAPLAHVVDRVGQGLRAHEAHRQEVASQLAGPRATARLLAGLPALGLLLGTLTGAEPVQFLLGTPAGVVCLLAGVTLDLAGLWWVERLARGAEETS